MANSILVFSVINWLLGCLIDPTPTNQNMPTFMNHVKNDSLDSLEITAGYIDLQNSITSVLWSGFSNISSSHDHLSYLLALFPE
jgi:hypothetical protein